MKALFIFAHPDDESFSSGGLIAKLSEKGINVKLITATKGEEGELGDPPVCLKKDLGKTREKELLKASKILGISRVYFLGFLDSTLKKIPTPKLVNPILKILKKEKPDLVFTFNKDGGSRHPDHVKINKAATKAFDLYAKNTTEHIRLYYTANPRSNIKLLEGRGIFYSAFGKVRGVANERITTIVDISKTFNKKLKALAQHKSQNKDVARFIKSSGILKIHNECFFLAREYNLI